MGRLGGGQRVRETGVSRSKLWIDATCSLGEIWVQNEMNEQ